MKKQCNKCLNFLELIFFSKNKNGKFGYRSICKECDKKYHQKNYIKNKDKIQKNNSTWMNKNKEKFHLYTLDWIKNNKIHVRNYHKNYLKIKRNTDISFKIAHNLRVRILQAIKKNYKSLGTMFLIGCDKDYLMYYLQNKFKSGMSWDNYGVGGWVIDHIKPCASFDLTKESEQKKCFNYKNLQPLWFKENQIKSFKY